MTLRKVCIVMNIGTISYWFFEAFESMKKNMKNVLISISTMFATMLIVACGYMVLVNANSIIEQKQEASSKIMAYLDIDVTEDEVNTIKTRLMGMQGVKKVEYISQDEAIKKAGEIKNILVSGYTEEQLKEIYQPYFKVTFETLEAQDEIIIMLRNSDGVGKNENDVVVSESAEKAIKEAQSTKIIAITAMILIIELSVFLMVNTMKLMLYARRKEISIMKYVGAKDTFVKMPFAIEGVIMSLVAVLMVILLVRICYNPIIEMIGRRASYKYMTLEDILPNLRLMLVVIGTGIGIFGSTMSMNKYLDV